MKNFILIIAIFIFPTIDLTAQVKNSNEKVIAEFYDAKKKRVNLDGGKVSLDIKLFDWERGWIYSKSDTRSAIKNNAIFFKFGLTNTKDFFSLNNFDFENNNGLLFGLGFQHGFDRVFLNDDNEKNPLKLQANTISITYKYDKFNSIENSTSNISKATPSILTANIGHSWYFWFYKNNYALKGGLVPTITLTGNIIDYNKSELQNYIQSDNFSTINNYVITSNKSFDGKFGMIDETVRNVQLAFSLPFVPDYDFEWFPTLAPIPYASYLVDSNQKPILNGGIAIGFLGQPLLADKIEDYDGEGKVREGKFRKFNVPSFLSVSVDWNYQNGQGSKPNYFITGTLALK
ncbi:hypothetical protein [Christiangramia echinicola]|uniref:hypothetical protein n=1 Tax=Christiangramia echinicola TaxID=279359 RepID=UPI000409028F|nr:hypothetical protein [Christiangramia echinicola]